MTGNPRELAKARRAEAEATALREAVEQLPRRVTSLVYWSNGVTWRRVGDDAWESLNNSGERWPESELASSSHVARGTIVGMRGA